MAAVVLRSFESVALVASVLLSILLASCTGGVEPRHAFYYWRSSLELSTADTARLRTLGVQRIYLRFFDVDWDEGKGEGMPVAILRPESRIPPNVEVVPTVFITNEVMKRSSTDAIGVLAARVKRKVNEMVGTVGGRVLPEIQIDCDWTSTTQASYFEFLRELTRSVPTPAPAVTATIRLHQLKYRAETGVPPVGRGMLMAYNVGVVNDPKERNSIFSYDEIEKYLDDADTYPLALDVALPLFSWGVVFHFDRFAVLINNLRRSDLDSNRAFKRLEENWYQAVTDVYLNGEHLVAGDRVRIEEVDADECIRVAELLASELKSAPETVSLYHFDPAILKNYPPETIEKIYEAFR